MTAVPTSPAERYLAPNLRTAREWVSLLVAVLTVILLLLCFVTYVRHVQAAGGAMSEMLFA